MNRVFSSGMMMNSSYMINQMSQGFTHTNESSTIVMKQSHEVNVDDNSNHDDNKNAHVPIMVQEIITALKVRKNGCYVDATLGGAGHTKAILEKGGMVFGIDRDLNAIENAKYLINEYPNHLELENRSFAKIDEIWQKKINPLKIDGILFDLGFSSNQIQDADRGFAFSLDGPLDMRFDLGGEMDAQRWINTADSDEIADVFFKYGQEKNSRKIAKSIVKHRKKQAIETTTDLVKIIEEHNQYDSKHVATRIFQAIRIHVNDEFTHIQKGLYHARKTLKRHGVLAVLTFHSLEDKIVKDFFENEVSFLLLPSASEIAKNPRARSAKLRWMIKTEA